MTGNELKSRRTGLKLSQEKMANDLGVAVSTVARWEQLKEKEIPNSGLLELAFNSLEKEFVVCVVDPRESKRKGLSLVHPLARIYNGNPDKHTPPFEFVKNLEEKGVYKGNKLIFINKPMVSPEIWDDLLFQLREPTERKTGVYVAI